MGDFIDKSVLKGGKTIFIERWGIYNKKLGEVKNFQVWV